MNTANRLMQFNMDRDAHRAIRHLAIERGTSVAAIVREALGKHVPEIMPLMDVSRHRQIMAKIR